jgi:hypothetical protein
MKNYNSDFYGWTQEQAAILRSGRFSEVDIVNLIEEVESMGRSERRELVSRLSVLLSHLLKWRYQAYRRGTSWELSIKNQRLEFSEVLDENPSLKSQLAEILEFAYKKARITAAKETKITLSVFPEICPWSYEQILDDDFYPA